ncbi:MAG: hypothetical protein ABIP41_08540, partial [Croceibacterium sp.]
MTKHWMAPRAAAAALLLAGLGGGAFAGPANAQDDARIRKVEAEVKALQRAVFPGGGGDRFFTPEVTPGGQTVAAGATPSGPPSPTALTDVLARLDALESQVQRLTAQTEEKGNALAQLQKRYDDSQAALAAAAAPPPEPAAQPTGVISLPTLAATTPKPAASAPRTTPA